MQPWQLGSNGLLGAAGMGGVRGQGDTKIPLPGWFGEGQRRREMSFQQWQREKMLRTPELWSVWAKRSGNFQGCRGMRGWHGAQRRARGGSSAADTWGTEPEM